MLETGSWSSMTTFRQQPLKLSRTTYLPFEEVTGFPRCLSNGYSLLVSIYQKSIWNLLWVHKTDLFMPALEASNSSAQTRHDRAVRRRVLY